jgi:hypothetical protein
MKIAPLIIAAALGCGAIGAAAAAPQDSAVAVQPEPPQIEPGAVDALARMSAYLHTIPAFEITLQTQRDDVDVYGQLITLSGSATYKVRQPDAFFIDLSLPSLVRQYVYDGKTMTAYDVRGGSYATYQAPSTIRATLNLAEQHYGATVPLDDLFNWDVGNDEAKALTAAHYIGKEQVAGQTADHYAFRQPGTDWQIWIAEGDKPAPLRIVIVASDDPGRPQFRADLTWNTSPQFSPDVFAFAPPPNAHVVGANLAQ